MNSPASLFRSVNAAKPKPAPAPKPGKGVPLPGYPERKGLDEPTIWKGKPKRAGSMMGLGLAAAVRRR